MDAKAIARELINIHKDIHLDSDSPFIPVRAQDIMRTRANRLLDIARGMDEEVYQEWYNSTRYHSDHIKAAE